MILATNHETEDTWGIDALMKAGQNIRKETPTDSNIVPRREAGVERRQRLKETDQVSSPDALEKAP